MWPQTGRLRADILWKSESLGLRWAFETSESTLSDNKAKSPNPSPNSPSARGLAFRFYTTILIQTTRTLTPTPSAGMTGKSHQPHSTLPGLNLYRYMQ